ncbi:ribonuclease VapC [Rhodoplanes tepidamans]|uniref:type II toxin-antitoxin system VapC family toxin n=1 Tax=Rhodoplanes TaxID=29407 RepID=UPI00278A1E96|nr:MULTISPECIES: type II toxin-antitoxin system VapC family toxin [Rhodoplanes]MDQ0353663.1 ribonuclease VapC [Rhodoplanes tepidamans]
MIFVDTSAIVAILTSEPEATELARAIEAADGAVSAGHVVLEAAMRLSTLLGVTPTVADGLVTRLLREARITIVPITEETAHLAVAAFERYGKGRHEARLNFGDCLSYACAAAHDAALLFKGEDFAATDARRA